MRNKGYLGGGTTRCDAQNRLKGRSLVLEACLRGKHRGSIFDTGSVKKIPQYNYKEIESVSIFLHLYLTTFNKYIHNIQEYNNHNSNNNKVQDNKQCEI